jgi:hypothetical protein
MEEKKSTKGMCEYFNCNKHRGDIGDGNWK